MENKAFKIVSNQHSSISKQYNNPKDAWNSLRFVLIDEYTIKSSLIGDDVACLNIGILYVIETVWFSSGKYHTDWKPIYKDILNNEYQEVDPLENLSNMKV